MAINIQEEVILLIREAARLYGEEIPLGAHEQEITGLEARTNLRIPPELRDLLRWSIAPPVGASRFYSIDPGYGIWRIEDSYAYHPIWRERGWIPLISDGCGSDYVLDTSTTIGPSSPVSVPDVAEPLLTPTHAIYFMDHEDDDDKPSYIVASGLWRFLRFLLRSQGWQLNWPFEREKVLAEDPYLATYRGKVPLPWEDD